MGPFSWEHLVRSASVPAWTSIDEFQPVRFDSKGPQTIISAMAEFQAVLDALRDGGAPASQKSACPTDLEERSHHLKAFGYFNDASMVGCGPLAPAVCLPQPVINPDTRHLAQALNTRQITSLASGIDLIIADLKDALQSASTTVEAHTHLLVFVYPFPRDPAPGELGCDWIQEAQAQRATLRSAETAVVIANYLRVLGYQAKAHTGTSTDLHLPFAALHAGVGIHHEGKVIHPTFGDRFGIAAVSTDFEFKVDLPLAPLEHQPTALRYDKKHHLPGLNLSLSTRDPYLTRKYAQGPHPFEKIKRTETPTTYIDETRVPRVPKRTDMFVRALFGDLGQTIQNHAKNGHYVRKSAPSMAQRRALGALTVLQDGDPAAERVKASPQKHADLIKATAYFLGADAVGISRCPEWAWYSHDTKGHRISPPHDQAISIIIDQGFDTTDGSSGDDWISVAQSMRAYLRFALIGGILAQQIRNLGYKAKAHTVLDGDVLHPPLLLLSGLGEVSRIGEVILNPYLGPRLKSGVVTTDLPLAHDKPIDFGLQTFCDNCQKCARECPSGAITAGPKRMFNGYEIWKSDSQKCATYRITQQGGAMCGRCMKTCPWNLEGIFSETPFRWAAIHAPQTAPLLTLLDDSLGRGEVNPAKKWWWDLELGSNGAYLPPRTPPHKRPLNRNLKLKHEEQTLAVYPASLAPPPWPYPFMMDREAGIRAYKNLQSVDCYRRSLAEGQKTFPDFVYPDISDPPIVHVKITAVHKLSPNIYVYVLRSVTGESLPEWTAGAHIDVLIAPEYLRPYSLMGQPSDRSQYTIGVLREDQGRGGSMLLHRIFEVGRTLFVSKPSNQFPLQPEAKHNLLMAGGIGVTPLIAMAHHLYKTAQSFELHYSVQSRDQAGLLRILDDAPWASKLKLYVSQENTRVDFSAIFSRHQPGWHLYTCGPHRYMEAVRAEAPKHGFTADTIHHEPFSSPPSPSRENMPFALRLARSGRIIRVSAEQTAAQALQDHGLPVPLKCADGLCGVCQCPLIDGLVDHRDQVLSTEQRRHTIILCQSRATNPNGILDIDL